MEGIITEVTSVVLEKFGVLGFFVCLSGYLLWVVFRDRKRHVGNGNGKAYVTKADLESQKTMTDKELAYLAGRVSDNYNEFLKFKDDVHDFEVKVAETLATKEDLNLAVATLAKHIDLAIKRR